MKKNTPIKYPTTRLNAHLQMILTGLRSSSHIDRPVRNLYPEKIAHPV